LYANVLKTERLVDMVDGTAHTMAIIDRGFAGMLEAVQESRRRLRPCIAEAAETIGTCFLQGGKLLICGNGGSAADAQHFAAELVGRFKREGRPGLPALALTADTAMLTAWSNDIGFDDVFARQVEAFGRAGDVLLGISTSGRSHNLVCAFERARRQGLRCIALLGRDGGDLLALTDVPIVVPSFETQHIQEVHMVVIHLLCELVEERYSTRQQYQSEAPAPVESILELPARRSRRQSSRAGAHA
jgi:D-inositol-3-phosphate glycosyltransferase